MSATPRSTVVAASAPGPSKGARQFIHPSNTMAWAPISNLRIHRSFVEVLDNPVMLDLFDVVWQGARGLAMFRHYLAHTSESSAIDVAHEHLIVALENGPDIAEQSMQEHIAAGRVIHQR